MSVLDVSKTIIAKSDQLNADDLVGGPITVTINDVKITSEEQPVAIAISGGHQPWKPCKTMRRVLAFAWGKDAKQWIGKSLTLKRDPDVKWAGEAVGGIRIQAMSDISQKLEMSLAETRGKKRKFVVEKLTGSGSLPDHSAAFTKMKDVWKSRREDRGLAVTPDEFAAFIASATDGVIAAKDALVVAKFTAETIEHCRKVINETMPEQV